MRQCTRASQGERCGFASCQEEGTTAPCLIAPGRSGERRRALTGTAERREKTRRALPRTACARRRVSRRALLNEPWKRSAWRSRQVGGRALHELREQVLKCC